MTADALAAWCHVRNQIDWAFAVGETPAPVEAAVDGIGIWCRVGDRYSNAAQGDRLSAALAQSRADASRKRTLTCALLAEWQRLVLGMPEVPFRQGDAFAKGGRERYALTPHTQRAFEHCLGESADPRAGGSSAGQVGPLQTTRYADDASGAADLAALVSVLIRSTHRRATEPVTECEAVPHRSSALPPPDAAAHRAGRHPIPGRRQGRGPQINLDSCVHHSRHDLSWPDQDCSRPLGVTPMGRARPPSHPLWRNAQKSCVLS